MKLWLWEIFVVFAIFVILCKTAELLPLTWDEGDSFARADSILKWSSVSGSTRFSEETILKYWPHTICREGHPAGYSIVIALGKCWADQLKRIPCLETIVSEKVSYRIGPIFLFSLAMGAVFYRVKKTFNKLSAFFCILSILLIPRLFAHCHIAACDSVLISCWLLTWAFFPLNHFSIRQAVFCGFWLGLTFSAKFSGWIAPIPFLIFTVLSIFLYIKRFVRESQGERDQICFCNRKNFQKKQKTSRKNQEILQRNQEESQGNGEQSRTNLRSFQEKRAFFPSNFFQSSGNIFLIGIIALIVFILFNPPIWRHPFSGLQTFFGLNITRSDFNIPIYFLGRLYSPECPLPWFNTIIWVAITVPIGLLFWALWGIFYYFRSFCQVRLADSNDQTDSDEKVAFNQKRQLFLLTFLNFIILLIVRAFPGVPVHDGVRLFIPAFAFLGILAGMGAFLIWSMKLTKSDGKHSLFFVFINRFLVLTVLFISFGSLYSYSPQWLSFYNIVIGGPRGARNAGFESTYYWDALDSDVIQWINQNTKNDISNPSRSEKILLGAFSSQTLSYYRKFGLIQPKCQTISSRRPIVGNFRFYVLQRRASGLTPVDLWLIRNAKPVYRKKIGLEEIQNKRNWFAKNQNVIILDIYSFDDFKRAVLLCH